MNKIKLIKKLEKLNFWHNYKFENERIVIYNRFGEKLNKKHTIANIHYIITARCDVDKEVVDELKSYLFSLTFGCDNV